jgi:hypothetical protein
MFSESPQARHLFDALMESANPTGGWGYEVRKASRLEPTCWALVAAGLASPNSDLASHRTFLEKCVRTGGYLVEDPRWPINVAFNALVAFASLSHRGITTDERIRGLLAWLTAAKGVQAPQAPSYRQDNSLQGWAWLDATFSWVEPTAWGTLALHKGLRAGFVQEAPARARIDEAERLLIDRCCRDGGWNFGNANVMGQDLFPHVPTTAIALLALQGRPEEPAVVRSLAYLESHWSDEPSPLALGLSLICLHTYGRASSDIESRLRALENARAEHAASGSTRPKQSENLHALAVAATALSLNGNDQVFRI